MSNTRPLFPVSAEPHWNRLSSRHAIAGIRTKPFAPLSWFVIGLFRNRDRSDDAQTSTNEGTIANTLLFRIARLLFGGVLAFLAINNLRELEERIQYAEAKNAPLPKITVPAVSSGLLFGGIGIALWRIPSAAAAAIVWFFVSITPVMHDFWNVDNPEQQQQEIFHFLKNTAILGAALAFLKLARSHN